MKIAPNNSAGSAFNILAPIFQRTFRFVSFRFVRFDTRFRCVDFQCCLVDVSATCDERRRCSAGPPVDGRRSNLSVLLYVVELGARSRARRSDAAQLHLRKRVSSAAQRSEPRRFDAVHIERATATATSDVGREQNASRNAGQIDRFFGNVVVVVVIEIDVVRALSVCRFSMVSFLNTALRVRRRVVSV